MDVRTGFVVEGLAVVEVEEAFCAAGVVEHDYQGEGVEFHEAAAAAGAVAAGEDVAGLHEQRNFIQGGGDGDRFAGAVVGGVVEVVVVCFARRKIDVDGVGGLGDNGFCKEAGGAEVQLVVEGEGGGVGGVDVVVGPDDGGAGGGGFVKGGVPGWQKAVAEAESLRDDGCVWFAN